MINPTFKQVVQASTKTLQAVKNVEGIRGIATSSLKAADDTNSNNPGKSKCDTGRCSRLNMDTKGFLNMPEMNYLQPSKTQQGRKKFNESKPIIKPEIVYEHEQYCREKEECRTIQRKEAEDNVKKP